MLFFSSIRGSYESYNILVSFCLTERVGQAARRQNQARAAAAQPRNGTERVQTRGSAARGRARQRRVTPAVQVWAARPHTLAEAAVPRRDWPRQEQPQRSLARSEGCPMVSQLSRVGPRALWTNCPSFGRVLWTLRKEGPDCPQDRRRGGNHRQFSYHV